MTCPVIVVGGGGHAKVLIDALRLDSVSILGIVDANPDLAGKGLLGVPVIGDDTAVLRYKPDEVLLVNGIGSVELPARRKELFDRFKELGFGFAGVVHRSAVIGSDIGLGEGVQIMAGAVLQPGSRIGCNAIVNTNASVDHDCIIGNHVHLAPGVTLSGGVRVGNNVHIGTGTNVVQGVCIGDNCVVGAGSLILQDVPAGATVAGVPVREIKK